MVNAGGFELFLLGSLHGEVLTWCHQMEMAEGSGVKRGPTCVVASVPWLYQGNSDKELLEAPCTVTDRD